MMDGHAQDTASGTRYWGWMSVHDVDFAHYCRTGFFQICCRLVCCSSYQKGW